MNPFTFQTTPNVLFEAGASRKIAGLVSEFGARRVLFVTDKGVRGAGLTREAEASLAAGGDLTVFEDVVADPPSHVVEAAVALCRDQRIDAVVSIGGGSALDTAKLVAYLARSGDRLDDIYGGGLAKGQRLPLLLAPTTAGTGSEVTPIAIVTTPTTEKKGVVSPRLLPDWAILDPELTLGLPPHVTAATGIDAMVHAIEAYQPVDEVLNWSSTHNIWRIKLRATALCSRSIAGQRLRQRADMRRAAARPHAASPCRPARREVGKGRGTEAPACAAPARHGRPKPGGSPYPDGPGVRLRRRSPRASPNQRRTRRRRPGRRLSPWPRSGRRPAWRTGAPYHWRHGRREGQRFPRVPRRGGTCGRPRGRTGRRRHRLGERWCPARLRPGSPCGEAARARAGAGR